MRISRGAATLSGSRNTDVQRWLRRHRGYSDKEGIFILDPTLVPLPDNPNYREAALLPLDQEGQYVDVQKLSVQERKRFKYTRAYKLTMLLHWSRQDDYFLFAAGDLGKGDESGLKRGEQLVDQFVSEVGKGVIKLLIMVRVFFVLLTYTLIQLYLKATHREELATKTIETLKQEERLGKDAVIV